MPSPAAFTAYRVFAEAPVGRFVTMSVEELDPGEVVIEAHYSSINYKDALAGTGTGGKIMRRLPMNGGVDVSGVVHSSSDPRFTPGQAVLVTGYGMSMEHDGGFSQYVRVPADWMVPLPEGLSLFEAMALGTAGFTAALAIQRLEQNELTPASGKVIVTGATGGVSSLGIQMLAQRGYHVVALTGKDHEHDYLRQLGAQEVLPRHEVAMGTRPLEKPLWAGALDAVGGDTLAWLTRTMQQNGAIASFGNAGGIELHTTVLPFLLRGIRLLGVDSAATPMPLRQHLWQRLASDLRPADFTSVIQTHPLSKLPDLFPQLLNSTLRGRVVVDLRAE